MATGHPEPLRLFQISISSLDLDRLRSWYLDGLGMLPSGGFTPAQQTVSDLGALQGIPDARMSQIHWAVDRQDFFQWELFSYSSPGVKPLPADWRPCDIGYSVVTVWVAAFEAALANLARLGSLPMTAPQGAPGSRRACVRDPDGTIVELLEADIPTPACHERPRPDVPAMTRAIRVSTPDLDRSLAFFRDTLCLPEAEGNLLHGAEHETLWGLPGANCETRLLYAGELWLELAQYTSPAGKPWPEDYLISDQGLFNIGLGTRSRPSYSYYRQRLIDAGYLLHPEASREDLSLHYVVDDQGFSIQLNFNGFATDLQLGFIAERDWPTNRA